jgi:translin
VSLEAVLQEIKKELMKKNTIRESTHDSMRKATSLSKQTILLIHQKKIENAESSISQARTLLYSVQEQAKEYPEVIYGGMLSAAFQEYSEANILLTLIKEGRFTAPKEIEVPSIEYVLGLADVIGEYRRLALDYLREGEVDKGVKCLEIMDEVFIQLLALDEAYMLVPGLRHKSDIARRIIETTRGDITLEVRRKSLEDYLKEFQPLTTKTKPKKAKAKTRFSQTKQKFLNQEGA